MPVVSYYDPAQVIWCLIRTKIVHVIIILYQLNVANLNVPKSWRPAKRWWRVIAARSLSNLLGVSLSLKPSWLSSSQSSAAPQSLDSWSRSASLIQTRKEQGRRCAQATTSYQLSHRFRTLKETYRGSKQGQGRRMHEASDFVTSLWT